MHGALGNTLAVLVREFLYELVVLHEQRPTRTGGDGVLVVRHRRAGGGGECRTFSH
jgi:hypothetical protein